MLWLARLKICRRSTMPPKRKTAAISSSDRTDPVPKKKSKATTSRKKPDKKIPTSDAKETATHSAKKKHYPKKIDSDSAKSEENGDIDFTEPLPKKNARGQLVFPDQPDFRPNMTPKEVLQAGSFGGTYYRPIKSGVTGKSYSGVWKELPKDWLEGLNISKQVSSPTYDNEVNTYKVKCGGSLQMWEESGWIHKQDPYGWFQWYCRFYRGRRSVDDERQVGRWLRCAGVNGRWRNNLISKCVRSGCAYDNRAVSPVVRQTLQHWGYQLTKEDYEVYAKKMKKKGQV